MNIASAIVEVAGDGQAVTSIVSAAAEDEDRSIAGADHFQGHVRRGDGGVFHEHDAGNVVALGGEFVDSANLLSREADHGIHYTPADAYSFDE